MNTVAKSNHGGVEKIRGGKASNDRVGKLAAAMKPNHGAVETIRGSKASLGGVKTHRGGIASHSGIMTAREDGKAGL